MGKHYAWEDSDFFLHPFILNLTFPQSRIAQPWAFEWTKPGNSGANGSKAAKICPPCHDTLWILHLVALFWLVSYLLDCRKPLLWNSHITPNNLGSWTLVPGCHSDLISPNCYLFTSLSDLAVHTHNIAQSHLDSQPSDDPRTVLSDRG